jgi:hypothetical protein
MRSGSVSTRYTATKKPSGFFSSLLFLLRDLFTPHSLKKQNKKTNNRRLSQKAQTGRRRLPWRSPSFSLSYKKKKKKKKFACFRGPPL